jgi:DNA repair exonuclease SbcCD nuclease subunit
MKIVVSSDWHGDHVTMGVSRHAEIRAAVKTTVDVAIGVKADAYLFLGDLCDPEGPGVFRSIEMATWAALTLARAGVPSLWLAGNHDVLEDGSGETTLTPLRPLTGGIVVAELPGVYGVGSLDVVALPFTATSHAYDPRTSTAKLADGRVVVSHLNVPGIIPGEEVTDMPRGRGIAFPFEETKGARARLQGHYHRQQSFDPGDGGPPIMIPGSLARLTFGEGAHVPSYFVLELS